MRSMMQIFGRAAEILDVAEIGSGGLSGDRGKAPPRSASSRYASTTILISGDRFTTASLHTHRPLNTECIPLRIALLVTQLIFVSATFAHGYRYQPPVPTNITPPAISVTIQSMGDSYRDAERFLTATLGEGNAVSNKLCTQTWHES